MQAAQIRGLFVTIAQKAEGSYSSIESATAYVNELLQANREKVDSVAAGRIARDWLEHRVGSQTGKEAFRPAAEADPHIRPTYNVGALLIHDRRAPRGYRILTSYPLNDYQSNK